MDRELASLDEQEKDELAALDKELSARREAISEEIARKKVELEERKSGYDREQLDSLTASGGDPRRLEEIHSRLAYIGGEIKYINETKALIIEYLKDKREMLDKVPDWTAESLHFAADHPRGTGGIEKASGGREPEYLQDRCRAEGAEGGQPESVGEPGGISSLYPVGLVYL